MRRSELLEFELNTAAIYELRQVVSTDANGAATVTHSVACQLSRLNEGIDRRIADLKMRRGLFDGEVCRKVGHRFDSKEWRALYRELAVRIERQSLILTTASCCST